MKLQSFVFSGLALGGAALLLAPPQTSLAFTKNGGSLSYLQRDVRVFDNFADATANNNITPHAQFPGQLGVEMAMWKGIVEWGSGLHGNGTGDPLGGNLLGNGGANFDTAWGGKAAAVGNTDNNVISKILNCSSGVLAFTEYPVSNGWRIRFCESWTWDDGPGTVGTRWDIQSVAAHEYGHALGLGHSTTGGATMFPSGSAGQTTLRSIGVDDANGVKSIYGTKLATKPVITAASVAGTDVTITGSNFDLLSNEVWFTNATTTATGADPRIIVAGVASTGTSLTVTIPLNAGDGDCLVKTPGTSHDKVSNAFPIDLP